MHGVRDERGDRTGGSVEGQDLYGRVDLDVVVTAVPSHTDGATFPVPKGDRDPPVARRGQRFDEGLLDRVQDIGREGTEPTRGETGPGVRVGDGDDDVEESSRTRGAQLAARRLAQRTAVDDHDPDVVDDESPYGQRIVDPGAGRQACRVARHRRTHGNVHDDGRGAGAHHVGSPAVGHGSTSSLFACGGKRATIWHARRRNA